MLVVQEDPIGIEHVIDIGRYSNLTKLLRVTAYVLRFIANLKQAKSDNQGSKGVWSIREIEAAEKAWILYTQDEFQKEPESTNIKVQLGVSNQDIFVQGLPEYKINNEQDSTITIFGMIKNSFVI